MTIPTNWKDITISQYQRLNEIRNQTFEFEIEKEIAVLSVLTGIDIESLEKLPHNEIVVMARQTDFINKPLSERLTRRLRIGTRLFIVTLEAQKITAEQFILINRYTLTEASTIENLHLIMAVLTNERTGLIKHKLQTFDFDFENKANLFKEKLSIDKIYAPSVFFCKVYQSWLQATQTSLIVKANQLKMKAAKELKKIQQNEAKEVKTLKPR